MNDNMKLFLFGDVFKSQRGSRLIEADQVEGEIAYVSSTKINNGVSAYITPPDSMVLYNNKLSLSNSGSICHCFYHCYDFVASDHVTVVWLKDGNVQLTSNLALYIKPIIESMRYKYNFGREISDERLEKEKILLPAADGKPDWIFMENYIEKIKADIKWPIIHSANAHAISLKKGTWREFQMGGENEAGEDFLFVFRKGKRLTKANMQSGRTNFIGAISSNNGIRQLIDEEPLYDGNCITVNYNGSVGEAFYQDRPFWASDDVNVLYSQPWWKMNRYIAMFLITVIKENRHLFSYGRKWTMDKMKSTKLKLPVDSNGKPDFCFMERYMRSLQYADKIR